MNKEQRLRFKDRFYEEAEKKGLEITEDFATAIDNLVLGNNLFITAPAGCLSGDTLIRVNRHKIGKKTTIEDLWCKENGIARSPSRINKEGKGYKIAPYLRSGLTKVRSLNEEKNLYQLNDIKGVMYSGEKELYELVLLDGKRIKATKDHRFMTKEGWKRLENISESDLIMTDNTTKGMKTVTREERQKAIKNTKKRNRDISIKIGEYYPNKVVKWYNKDRTPQSYRTLHILTYEAEVMNNVSLETFILWTYDDNINWESKLLVDTRLFNIHHKDGNHMNNVVENLELLDIKSHRLLHSKGKNSETHFKYNIPEYSKVESITKLEGLHRTYDISCNDPHNSFVANNMLVHNCGKSAFTELVRSTYTGRMAVCGSTGVASANIKGVTLHSLFRLPLKGISKPTEFNKVADEVRHSSGGVLSHLDLLIIDEISMVKAYHIETVDQVLKNLRNEPFKPFGGCQIILVGDVGQLEPIVDKRGYEPDFLKENYGGNPFFFSCKAYRNGNFHYMEFLKNFRQKGSKELSETLNRIRDYSFTQEDLDFFNQRVVDEGEFFCEGDFVYLASTNRVVDSVNTRWLHSLEGEVYTFETRSVGQVIKSTIPDTIHLKNGSQVMMLKNDPDKNFYNGSLGHIVKKLDSNTVLVEVDGKQFPVGKYKEESIKYIYNKETNEVEEQVIGKREQLPLKLSYSLSVHKSQGLTLDRAFIDLGRQAFASGQAYVSLSRIRSIDGLGLKRPLTMKDFPKNEHLLNFLNENTKGDIDE